MRVAPCAYAAQFVRLVVNVRYKSQTYTILRYTILRDKMAGQTMKAFTSKIEITDSMLKIETYCRSLFEVIFKKWLPVFIFDVTGKMAKMVNQVRAFIFYFLFFLSF